MITVGVDVGSLMTKVVVMEDDTLRAGRIIPTVGNIAAQLPEFIEQTIAAAKVAPGDVAYVAATGSGAGLVEQAAFTEDEVICAGVAVGFFAPRARFFLHAGGQSIAAIRMDDEGDVADFVRNDKCASGSGRFIEMMSRKLEVPVEEIDALCATSTQPLAISNQCGVFAESEVIGHANDGRATADILAGVCQSVANILAAQARRFRGGGAFTFTGGVARFATVVDRVAAKLEGERLPSGFDPVFAAAIGAALLTETD